MTPDEAAFLKAITDNPEDETARLVYADWLADRDDPRAAFARLSADFLRCVRGLADAREALPVEWLGIVDPLFDRVRVFRLPSMGDSTEFCGVRAIHVKCGSRVTAGYELCELETDKAIMALPAEHEGLILSVLVHPGDRPLIGQGLFTYLPL